LEQNKSVVKLVVCDLDGTLIGPGDYGIEMAKHTLDFCRQKGSRVTIATGRSFGATKRYMTYLKINEPVISNGGAFIAKFGEPPIYEKTIDKDMSKSIALDLMNTIEHPFYFLVGKDMYTHAKGQETKRYSQLLGYHINIVDSLEDIPGEPTQIVLRVPIVEADEIQSYLNSKWSPNVTILKSMPPKYETPIPKAIPITPPRKVVRKRCSTNVFSFPSNLYIFLFCYNVIVLNLTILSLCRMQF